MGYENRRYGAPRQMTKVKCSDCGVRTEVRVETATISTAKSEIAS